MLPLNPQGAHKNMLTKPSDEPDNSMCCGGSAKVFTVQIIYKCSDAL